MNTIKKFNPSLRLIILNACILCFAMRSAAASPTYDSMHQPVPRINFLVSPKQHKIDLAPLSFQIQARLMHAFHKTDFELIVARSSEQMVKKIIRILKRKNAMIGNIWFDSHGHWNRRRSLFEIGNEEFNYRSIRDSLTTAQLQKLSAYCDSNTNVGIGSCYGGATYTLPPVENFPAQRMNGDSLMIGTSLLFNHATVYASESFVMTGPGILNAGYALSGMPGRKKFRDPIYEPVWEKLGEWNCYSGTKAVFEKPVTVSLQHNGRISYKDRNYLSFKRNKRKLERKLKKFKRGNYNISYLYQDN